MTFQTDSYKSFFGTVTGDQVASWVNNYGDRLFDQNVRSTLHKSEVNDDILDTIKNNPAHFWYFNNGITAIAAEVQPTPGDTDSKKIRAKSMSIVNGAQTAGMLARAANDGVDLSKILLQMRVISLSGASPRLDEEITKANNTQNELTPLDFVSLDGQQDIIRSDLAALGYEYVYRRGSDSDTGKPRIEVKDAAVARACAHSASLTAQAKRYVSGLWNDIRSSTYWALFNPATSGEKVLDAWSLLKFCETECKEYKQSVGSDSALIITHAEKLICHCTSRVAQGMKLQGTNEGALRSVCRKICPQVVEKYQATGDRTYPAQDFKSVKFLEDLIPRLKLDALRETLTERSAC